MYGFRRKHGYMGRASFAIRTLGWDLSLSPPEPID